MTFGFGLFFFNFLVVNIRESLLERTIPGLSSPAGLLLNGRPSPCPPACLWCQGWKSSDWGLHGFQQWQKDSRHCDFFSPVMYSQHSRPQLSPFRGTWQPASADSLRPHAVKSRPLTRVLSALPRPDPEGTR